MTKNCLDKIRASLIFIFLMFKYLMLNNLNQTNPNRYA